ncbi:MAG: hypothetical protein GY846_00595, partial [Deltaproteobacteria bacterium]|nr:hypothetical protein [Deltaproteobacteria bacterium]
WDDPDVYEDSGFDDEDPDYVSDDQMEDIAAFFSVAQSLFMDGKLEDARQVYDLLFDLVDYVEGVTYFSSPEELDIREARANYSRSIFETVKPKKRLDPFVVAMAVFASSPYGSGRLYDEKFPLLQDVMDAREGLMEGFEAFLSEWKGILSRHENSSRAAFLLLEAVHLTDGIAGISRLARQWRNSQPRGYLFWLELLKKENKQADIIEIGKEALGALENGPFREQVSEFLVDAAKDQNDPDALLFGKRERFFSSRSNQNLLDLVGEATEQNSRDAEIEGVLRFFETGGKADTDGVLYTKVLLMAGKLEEAVSEAKNEKGLGWSYGRAGVVFGAVLRALTGWSEEMHTIDKILRDYANRVDIYSGRISVENEKTPTFFQEILKGLQQHQNIKQYAEKCLPWAEKIGNSRINGIVSKQRRGAYDKAAQVLGALAETYIAVGNKEKAVALLHHYYHEKFNRHSAFRREVQSVVTGSEMLRRCGFP